MPFNSGLTHYDVIIIGAGAAGMMCAMTAGQRGRRVLLLDHARQAGEKIRISGGGRCNFTNLHTTPANFLSNNPHFCISALTSYTPTDFLALVEAHGIAWHEKTLGQLFCDGSSQQIIDLLLAHCRAGAVNIELATGVDRVASAPGGGFEVSTTAGARQCAKLVIATGGISIPKMGATGFAYRIAEQFGLAVVTPRAGLVPLTFTPKLKAWLAALSGLAVDVEVSCAGARFAEALLFTHRGLSGPAVLQISSYWQGPAPVVINLAPAVAVFEFLKQTQKTAPRQQAASALAEILPRRLAQAFVAAHPDTAGHLAELADTSLRRLADHLERWTVVPAGTEGLRKAEVTVGGVNTAALSSRDLQVKHVPGLYFIGEALDVTGHLGGHNFQWAWASGHATGRAV